jgi:hypothetical protein
MMRRREEVRNVCTNLGRERRGKRDRVELQGMDEMIILKRTRDVDWL